MITKKDFGFDSIEELEMFFNSFPEKYIKKLRSSIESIIVLMPLTPRREIRQKGRGGYVKCRSLKVTYGGRDLHNKSHKKNGQMILDIVG